MRAQAESLQKLMGFFRTNDTQDALEASAPRPDFPKPIVNRRQPRQQPSLTDMPAAGALRKASGNTPEAHHAEGEFRRF
jgi:hypothetical protein